MRWTAGLAALVVVISMAVDVAAQVRPPPPALMVAGEEGSRPLAVTRVAVEARIVGHLAETGLTMTFANSTTRDLEGDLYFPLPEGATVSGYALDVAGVMVDGVVVPKQQAREIFETEVRKGVDPGLVEWTRGNNFKTRVFPIPAGGTRTVRVSYVAEVVETGDGAIYHLPLAFREPVAEASFRVEVVAAATRPAVVEGGPEGLKFGAFEDRWVAEAAAKHVKLDRDLRVALPKLAERPVLVEAAPDGQVFFAVRDVVAGAAAATERVVPKRLAISWDASASRQGPAREAELEVLRRYLEGLGGAGVEAWLVVFRDAAEPARRFELPAGREALLKELRGVTYDGATQLGAAGLAAGVPQPDLHLVFSDGLSTLGESDPKRLTAPTWAVSSASSAHHAMLRHLSRRTGGDYLNLQRIGAEEAARLIGAPVFGIVGVEATGVDLPELYPQGQAPVTGAFTMAGRLTANEGTLTVRFGAGGRETARRSYVIRRAEAAKGDLLRRHWAERKVDALLALPEENAREIVEVGTKYGLVTPGTSLLVLERLDQYVAYRVRPPMSLPKMQLAYDQAVAELDRERRVDREAKLERVVEKWRAYVAWWETKFEVPPGFKWREPAAKKGSARAAGAARSEAADSAREMPAPAAEAERELAGEEAKDDAPAPAGGPQISIKPWNPDTPYLAALRSAPKAERYAAYVTQRGEHGAAPAFYVDVADFFEAAGDRAMALRVLSNLAEMELESAPMLRVLGHRLAQLGELDLAASVFEEVLGLRPEEPQSHRDLALVLERRADAAGDAAAKRADYEEAMRLLGVVVMQEWARFDEIELVALVELNHILAKAKTAGVEDAPIDPRLVKHLTMDVRIVMTWDADLTDMDLHVVEPTGEEAYYGHNRTTIGGAVSRDFTQGYGPEVYAVRRALKGKYEVKTKYYGASTARLIGAVTLQVDFFTRYGVPSEQRRTVTVRLTESKETFTVADIVF